MRDKEKLTGWGIPENSLRDGVSVCTLYFALSALFFLPGYFYLELECDAGVSAAILRPWGDKLDDEC